MTTTMCATPLHPHSPNPNRHLFAPTPASSASAASSSSSSTVALSSRARPCRSPKRVKATPPTGSSAHASASTHGSHHHHSHGLSSAGSSSSALGSANGHRRTRASTKGPEEGINGGGLGLGTGMGVRMMYAATSPCRSPGVHEGGWGKAQRRREMSVPLLSQTLSHFSLSQSTPPLSTTSPRVLPTSQGSASRSPLATTTPRRSLQPLPPLTTPSMMPSGELVYPSTAPLPSLPNFLGSPFNTKTRGDYFYHLSTSPIAFRQQRESMSSVIEPPEFELGWESNHESGDIKVGAKHRSEWLEEETEWIADRPFESNDIDDEVSHHHLRSYTSSTKGHSLEGRRRRDTSGSSSSVDDLSGSGTSTSSLSSLVRQFGDHSHRPSVITIWGDELHPRLDDEDEQPATPSRDLFTKSEGGIHITSLSTLSSPALSPLVEKRALRLSTTSTALHSPANSPLTHQRTTSSATVVPRDSCVSPVSKPVLSRSPLANLLPRLMSSRITGAKQLRNSPQDFDTSHEDTDTEDVGTTILGSPKPRTSTEGREDSPEGISGTIGLGIFQTSPSDPSPPLRRSQRNSPQAPTPAQRSKPGRRSAHNSAAKATPATLVQPRIRPTLRRGVTEPHMSKSQSQGAFDTPPAHLFGDVKPSPAAFASTGLVKKKGARLSIPHFGDAGAPMGKARSWSSLSRFDRAVGDSGPTELVTSPGSPLSPIRMGDVAAGLHRGPRTISGAAPIPKSRGLRRKRSTMFTSSGSIGSEGGIERLMTSPATPTKPFVHAFTVGISTPSPTSAATLYPFAPSTAMTVSSPTDSTGAVATPVGAGPVARIRELARGPVARTSNPMLAAAYHASAPVTAQSSRFDTDARKDNKNGVIGHAGSNRLERDFHLIQSVGSGEFSKVWKVKEKATGKLWAVKAGKPYSGVKNRLRQLEEASILRQMSLAPHPHVVDFVDSWEQHGRLYIRTELAECGDLARFLLALGDCGGLGESRVWKTLVELSSALSHIHALGFLHLDLKPSNVLITATGALKIGDFGMSIVLPNTPSESGDYFGSAGGLTVEGQGQGSGGGSLSPALPQSGPDGKFVWQKEGTVPSPILDREHEGDREYLCPEALEETTPRTPADVFSLGILLLEAALNVVLPSNGDGWVKLRNDDFSDLVEHYVVRDVAVSTSTLSSMTDASRPLLTVTTASAVNTHEPAPAAAAVLSESLMDTIKGMMRADPAQRTTLAELSEVGAVKKAKRAMEGEEERKARAALVEEDEEFLAWLLA